MSIPNVPNINIENAWYYYFSSLAQTIAGLSALLVALAVIKLQYLASALNDIERLMSESFFKIAKQQDYRREAFSHFLKENWRAYFLEVQKMANANLHSFTSSGDEYTSSKDFVDALISQGSRLHDIQNNLHDDLKRAFLGSVAFAGLSILAIPVAPLASVSGFMCIWGISGISLVALLRLYFKLVLDTLNKKHLETKQ